MEENKANQSNENTATNPTTEGSKNNVPSNETNIPKDRLDKVIGERNDLRTKLEGLNTKLAKIEEDNELKRQESLKEQGKYEKLYTEEKNLNKELTSKLESSNQFINEVREQQIGRLPEDKQEFARSLPDNKLNEFIAMEKTNIANTKSTSTSRPGAKTDVGEFGGYGSWEEFAVKDPVGAEKALHNSGMKKF